MNRRHVELGPVPRLSFPVPGFLNLVVWSLFMIQASFSVYFLVRTPAKCLYLERKGALHLCVASSCVDQIGVSSSSIVKLCAYHMATHQESKSAEWTSVKVAVSAMRITNPIRDIVDRLVPPKDHPSPFLSLSIGMSFRFIVFSSQFPPCSLLKVAVFPFWCLPLRNRLLAPVLRDELFCRVPLIPCS